MTHLLNEAAYTRARVIIWGGASCASCASCRPLPGRRASQGRPPAPAFAGRGRARDRRPRAGRPGGDRRRQRGDHPRRLQQRPGTAAGPDRAAAAGCGPIGERDDSRGRAASIAGRHGALPIPWRRRASRRARPTRQGVAPARGNYGRRHARRAVCPHPGRPLGRYRPAATETAPDRVLMREIVASGVPVPGPDRLARILRAGNR